MIKLLKPIPNQVINELAGYRPLNLRSFFDVKPAIEVRFTAQIKGGEPLPRGMIVTADGFLTGIPGRGTQGSYEIEISIEQEGEIADANFLLVIKPSLIQGDLDQFSDLKSQIWHALENRLPVPDLAELYDRPITEIDIYYLLERWGTLTIWDAFNLEPPGEKKLITLAGQSQHYDVYDRGCCLIAAPKDLYNYERTVLDGMLTARAMAREVYKRNWTIELTGVDKMSRAAWVEMQHLADKYGKSLEILNFKPTPDDVKIYKNEATQIRMKGGEI